jgi:putative transposase
MSASIQPLQLLLVSVAGWMSPRQQEVIACLAEENRVLKEQLGGRRLRLTDDQRRRLAAKGKLIGRRALSHFATLVTPDTITRWHRKLIALKWTFEAKTRVRRPGLMKIIKALIIRMATENSTWGYCRIQGELKGVGHRVTSTTIANVPSENGIRPAPDRPSSWRSILKAHWEQIAATDFFSTEVWTPKGLTTYYVLFVIDLKTRRAHLAGITTNPDGEYMAQIARNLTDSVDGFLAGHRFLICDRDGKFTPQFKRTRTDAGVQIIPTPPQAPNCNAFAERFVLSIKSECLNRMMLFGATGLRQAVTSYIDHYHRAA